MHKMESMDIRRLVISMSIPIALSIFAFGAVQHH